MPLVTAHAGPGDGPSLVDWPYLAWLPDRGVVTEDNHTPVAMIGKLAECEPDVDFQTLAAIAGTTAEHVRQALNYLAATAPAP